MVVRLDELGQTYGYIKEQYGALTCEEFGQWLHAVGLSQKNGYLKSPIILRGQVKAIMPSSCQINDVLQLLVAAWYSVRGTNATKAFLKATICIKTFTNYRQGYSCYLQLHVHNILHAHKQRLISGMKF